MSSDSSGEVFYEDPPRPASTNGLVPRGNGLLAVLAALLALVAMWACFRPYTGIRHDAWLYMLDAVFGTDPAFQASDLWVAFDPQSNWSGYSLLLTWMLRWLSPASVGIVAAGAGLLAWIGACIIVGKALLPNRWWIIGLVVVAGSPRYGGWGVFAFAEQFAAPRALSEAFVVASVGLALSRRYLWSLCLVGFAGLIHPLVAVPGVAVVAVMWWGPRTLRQMLGVLTLAVFCGLLLWWDPAGLGAAAGGNEWLAIVRARSPYLFVSNWDWGAWLRLAVSAIAVLVVAVDRTQARMHGLCRSILIVGLLGTTASFVLGDLFESPFALQLQLWRSIWLVHVGALLSLAWMAARWLGTRNSRHLVQTLTAALMLSIPSSVPQAEAWLVSGTLGSLTIAFGYPVAHRHLGPVARAFIWVTAAGILGIFAFQVSWAIRNPVDRDLGTFLAVFPGAGIVVVAILVLGVEAVRKGGWPAWIITMALAVLAFGAVGRWDGRTEWTRYTETLEGPAISSDSEAVVLVEDPEFGARFILGRPEYFTREAGSGVVFSSTLARVYEERRQIVASIDFLGSSALLTAPADPSKIGPPSTEGLIDLCGAAQGPTLLLLRRENADLPSDVWTPPVPPPTPTGASPHVSRTSFYLYTCDAVLGYQGTD